MFPVLMRSAHENSPGGSGVGGEAGLSVLRLTLDVVRKAGACYDKSPLMRVTEWPRDSSSLSTLARRVFEVLIARNYGLLIPFLREAASRGCDMDSLADGHSATMCWIADSADLRDCLIELGADPNLFQKGGCGPGCVVAHMWWFYTIRKGPQLDDLLRHVASGRLVIPDCCRCVPLDLRDGSSMRQARTLRAAYENGVYCALQSHVARDVASMVQHYLFVNGAKV